MPLPPDHAADAIDVSTILDPPAVGSDAWRALYRHERRTVAAAWGIDPALVVNTHAAGDPRGRPTPAPAPRPRPRKRPRRR